MNERYKKLVSCGVGPKTALVEFIEPTLQSVKNESYKARQAFLKWNGRPALATLVGLTGTGKSMLAAEAVWRHIRLECDRCEGTGWVVESNVAVNCGCNARKSAKWVRASRIVPVFFENRHAELRGLETTSLLVIDDLGRRHERAWGPVEELVSERDEHLRPTILTTNTPVEEIAESAAHLASRLGSGSVFEITGPDQRLQ